MRLLGLALIVVYPFVVYAGLSRLPAAWVALVIVALAALRLLAETGRGAKLGAAARPFLPVLVLGILAAALDDARFLLAMPVLVNAALLASFAATLRSGSVPAVERFARVRHPELSAEQVAWCRSVTWIWCGFFLANGTASAALAVAAPLSWWTLYNGFLAYLAIGALLGGEAVLRRLRFG